MILDEIRQMAQPKQPMILKGLLLEYHVGVAAWLSQRVMQGELFESVGYGIGIVPPGSPDRVVGRDEVVPLIAAAMFFDHHHGRGGVSDITICAAADSMRPVTPEVVRGILSYPFGVLKVQRITAFIDGRNHDAVKLMKRFGFQCEGAKRNMRDDGGEVLMFGLLERECTYMEEPEVPADNGPAADREAA